MNEQFNTADEFLEVMRRSHSRWMSKDRCPWMFRGQSKPTPPVPTAWRHDDRSKNFRHVVEHYEQTKLTEAVMEAACPGKLNPRDVRERKRHVFAQAAAEIGLVCHFARSIEDIGFDVHDDIPLDTGVTGLTKTFDVNVELTSPSPSFLGHGRHATIFALARHHGVPSRLLDWTANPLFAAFFAAENVEAGSSDNLAVWAINEDRLRDTEWCPIKVMKSRVGFLRAQEGLFLHRKAADDYFIKKGSWPELAKEIPTDGWQCLTLPHSEARRLRQLLRVERVSRGHLMPTFDHVYQAVGLMFEDVIAGTQHMLAESRLELRNMADGDVAGSSD